MRSAQQPLPAREGAGGGYTSRAVEQQPREHWGRLYPSMSPERAASSWPKPAFQAFHGDAHCPGLAPWASRMAPLSRLDLLQSKKTRGEDTAPTVRSTLNFTIHR